MYTGLAIAFAFLAIGLAPLGILADACVIASGICVVGIVVTALKRKTQAYDLATLRDIHEKEALKSMDREENLDYDSVVCLNCGEVYNMRLPFCPMCKANQGSLGCG